jgi:hypothetical protein
VFFFVPRSYRALWKHLHCMPTQLFDLHDDSLSLLQQWLFSAQWKLREQLRFRLLFFKFCLLQVQCGKLSQLQRFFLHQLPAAFRS